MHDDFYPHGEEERGTQAEVYMYETPGRTPHLQVRKFVFMADGKRKKRFPQRFHVNGHLVETKPAGWINLPYRLPELIAAPPRADICITEGEKDANTLTALGFVATCNPEGAGKWTADLNKWFVGRPKVILFEDNDPSGREHVGMVAAALADTVPDIRVVRFPDVPEKEDVTWWLTEGGHKKDELLARMAAAPKFEAKVSMPFIDISNWDNEPVPEQEWTVFDKIPRQQTVIFSGEGGAGKSMIGLNLCASHALGRAWLDTVLEQGPSIFIDAEDGKGVIHRRLAAIATHNDVAFADMVKGGLHLISLAGEDAVLATVSRNGKVESTTRYARLQEAAGDIKPVQIVIASSANIFAGNENDRSQVQQFVGMITRIAIVANGSVVLISHPSLTGISSESGLSGTTQWHNAVRARFYLRGVKPEDGEQPDNDLREIVFKKNQYGRLSENMVLRYEAGLFLPVVGAKMDQVEQETRADGLFLDLLRRFTRENRFVSDKPSVNYAPALFAKEDEAKRAMINSKQFDAAMRRLFSAGQIWNEPCGRPSRPTYRIKIKP